MVGVVEANRNQFANPRNGTSQTGIAFGERQRRRIESAEPGRTVRCQRLAVDVGNMTREVVDAPLQVQQPRLFATRGA